ncbi:hypothetical protein [[Clostridium] colinum]|uniref:hypothetical protein n=1 Tax=[Clostridium] colinum TaxID=36835 RepID=UPI0020252C03|nr:hypothetical protein [[Clostridium] colinum]
MNIKKHTLLLLAGFIWLLAGFNVLRIGLITYVKYINIVNILLSILIFLIFWLMIFKNLVFKHTNRIKNLDGELHFFLKFFDKKSFLIMFFMILFGVLIRTFNLLPDVFIAVFYSGLGSALFLAGILFLYNYIQFFRQNK